MSNFIVAGGFVGLAICGGIVFGYVAVGVVALMAASCLYGHALGYERGRQAGMTWYADMLREKGFYR